MTTAQKKPGKNPVLKSMKEPKTLQAALAQGFAMGRGAGIEAAARFLEKELAHPKHGSILISTHIVVAALRKLKQVKP